MTWVRTYLFSPVAIFLVSVVALILLGFGFKVYLGDMIRKIKGIKIDPLPSLEPVPTVDPKRINSDGTVIAPGNVDPKGWVQPIVYPVPGPDLFSSPTTVTVETDAGPLTVELPTGVEREDVKEVVILKPNVVTVTVENDHPVAKETLDSLIAKYAK